ncbi:S8 family serine peptidase [Kutzneria viridogrisea]
MLTAVGLAAIALAPTAGAAPAAPAHACDTTSTEYTYVVLYPQGTPRFVANTEVGFDCGKLVTYYQRIGVAVATSRNADFAARLGTDRAYSARKDLPTAAALASRKSSVESVTSTVDAAPAADLSGQQWDMDAIGAKKANKLNPGSRRVTVGVLDSGVDATHPDLAKAVDPSKSAGCLTGKPDTTPAAWAPTTSAHGTHVAGTIAAADDGSGVSGIAPGVRVASVKVVSDDGYIFPESAVCGFMWAAENDMQVTNNSYYVDPGFYFCDNKPGDSAAYEAIRRAVAYSTREGVLNVAAAGNEALDITNPTTDPVRTKNPVDKHCKTLPGGLSDVVSVSAVGYNGTKSGYSDWGGVDVTAPGGDGAQVPPAGKGPACPVSTLPGGKYGSMCGTSMASPHAVGVLALLASSHPYAGPSELRSLLHRQATPVACPSGVATCTGPAANNSYYGHGLVNALAAVQR